MAFFFGGGAAVAYVFIHVLPELSKRQDVFQAFYGYGFGLLLGHHLYLVAMVGMISFSLASSLGDTPAAGTVGLQPPGSTKSSFTAPWL